MKVVEKTDKRNKSGSRLYKCQCSCGNVHYVSNDCLIGGKTKSCGCLKRDVLRSQGFADRDEAIVRSLHSQTKKRHRNHNDEEECVTYDEYYKLIHMPCFYCGEEYSSEAKDTKTNTAVKYNGLDRVDNTKGYSKNNVVPCCTKCNKAKSTMTIIEFKEWVRKVYLKFGSN